MKDKISSKFGKDLIWNLFGFGLSGIVFVVINFILLNSYGNHTLGVFNEVYAVYLLLSQVAVTGIHLAIQSFIPKHSDDNSTTNLILTSGLILTLMTSTLIAGLAWIFKALPGELLDSPDVILAFQYAIPGLIFFALNKVLLSYHNGLRRMKSFAVFQALRVLFMLAALAILIILKADTIYVASLLSLAEAALFVCLLAHTLSIYKPNFGVGLKRWLTTLIAYGLKATPGNVLLDINTRVDVLMIGFFMTDGDVGIYSFALAIAEGVMQVPVLFRNNINPIITKAQVHRNKDLLSVLLRKNRNSFYKIIGGLGLVTILLFPLGLMVLALFLDIEDHFNTYWTIYSILIGALVISSGYMPFQMLFNQLGKPTTQSAYVLLCFMVNVIANFFLIQELGIYGAALGTAISIISQVFFLKFLVKRTTPYTI